MKNDVIHGRWYVRPPTLDIQSKDKKDFIEYTIQTKKDAKEIDKEYDLFMNSTDSFIYCNNKIHLKMPKPSLMIKNGKKQFAYAFGLFLIPKPANQVISMDVY